MQNKTNDEKLYMWAKETYYNGEPIMTDAEFDALEAKLKQKGSGVVGNVGAWDRRAKVAHPTPMLSLSKIQANKETGEAPVEEFQKWMDDAIAKIKKSDYYKSLPLAAEQIEIEYSQKLDGNAINVVYEDGVVKHVLSRGDGKYGREYLPRLINTDLFPKTIDWVADKVVEVRCEAVIPKDIFEKKYAEQFKNERNYVAGILNSEDTTQEQFSEIAFVPIEVRAGDGKGKFQHLYICAAESFGFKDANKLLRYNVTVDTYSPIHKATLSHDSLFEEVFRQFERLKTNDVFRIDGMVVKFSEQWRKVLGENEHDPNWALATKFKPEDCITEVTGFEFEMGKTGEFTPVAVLKPVDLDGSTVTKVSAYNYNFIKSNNLNVGSLVTLVKSGDIIPQIVNIINDVGEPYNFENMKCPYCGKTIAIENETHIKCTNPDCEGVALKRFINSMDALDVFGCGEAMCEEIFFNITHSPFALLEAPKDEIEKWFVNAGMTSKNHSKFIDEIKSKTTLPLETVIAMMSYEGMSNDGKTIKEVAKKIAGLSYDFKGFEKKVVEGWECGEYKRNDIEKVIKELTQSGINIVYPTQKETISNLNNTIRISMTGSPKPYGYATKTEFVKYLESLGYTIEEVDVKKCDILFTDNLKSNSGKMKTAHELGKEIKTYDNF